MQPETNQQKARKKGGTEEVLTCIICPRGCSISVRYDASTREIFSLEGAACRRGVSWAEQEIIQPMRILCSSIRVTGGRDPLASVRSDRPIPLESFSKVMDQLRKTTISAPVSIGDIIIRNPGGTDCSIIATRGVEHQ